MPLDFSWFTDLFQAIIDHISAVCTSVYVAITDFITSFFDAIIIFFHDYAWLFLLDIFFGVQGFIFRVVITWANGQAESYLQAHPSIFLFMQQFNSMLSLISGFFPMVEACVIFYALFSFCFSLFLLRIIIRISTLGQA